MTAAHPVSDSPTPEDALASAIAATGARHAFGVPGGGANLAMVGACERNGVEFVLAHGETAACIMASTYGHLTDSVTAAIVTRGPGAASAVNGAAQATLDRHPLLVVADAVASNQRSRVAHQRIDQAAMFAPVCKATATLSTTNAAAAVQRAGSWPAGCVHLDQDADGGIELSQLSASADGDAAAVADAIAAACRPVVILGIGAWRDAVAVRGAVERFGAPVLSTYQAVGIVATDSPVNAGLFTNGAPEQALLARADLVVAIGLDMVEPIPARWTTEAAVVSISPTPTVDPYAPIAHEVCGDVGALTQQCLDGDHEWTTTAAQDHRAATIAALRDHDEEGFSPVEVVDAALGWARGIARLTTTVDAGAHFLAIMPLWEVDRPGGLLISNGLATMGYAVPAAIGAALARPNEQVLALVGDGGLGMTLAELETIARLALPVTVVVFNDSELSLIRIKQRDGHGGRSAIAYEPTDFAAVARAQGMDATAVATADELAAALASPTDGPRLIDARIDPGAYPHLLAATRG